MAGVVWKVIGAALFGVCLAARAQQSVSPAQPQPTPLPAVPASQPQGQSQTTGQQPLAQPSQDAPRDYASVLLEVYGAMQGVRGVKEICNEAYPEFHAANEAAHAKWLEDYKTVRLEVVHRVDALVDAEAHGDSHRKLALRNDLRKEYAELKDGLREQYQGYGAERFKSMCSQYPQMTLGEAVNIPKVYRAELDIIRKGPQAERAEPIAALQAKGDPEAKAAPKSVAEGRPAKAAAASTAKSKGKAGKHAKAKPSKGNAAKGKAAKPGAKHPAKSAHEQKAKKPKKAETAGTAKAAKDKDSEKTTAQPAQN
jgi:hypothetical protein